jgi:hypothetical protein
MLVLITFVHRDKIALSGKGLQPFNQLFWGSIHGRCCVREIHLVCPLTVVETLINM